MTAFRFYGLMLLAILFLAFGCDAGDEVVTTAEATTLPACPPDIYPDHYCAGHTTAACWNLSALTAAITRGDVNPRAPGGSGCTVEVHPTVDATSRVECVPGCNDPNVPLPEVNVTVGHGFQWCYSDVDAQGLEQAICNDSAPVGYAAYAYPPYVLRCVAVCQ